MLSDSHEFHESIFPKLLIQVKGHPYQYRCSNYTEANANPLVNANHIHDDKNHKNGQQTSSEDEQVLGFQTFELHTFAYSFIDIKLHNSFGYEVD